MIDTNRYRKFTAGVKKKIWKESYNIRTYETDAAGNLSVISLCHLMQDAAEKNAFALGLAIQDLLSDDMTWVLSRMTLKIHTYPGWQDQIHIYTWPSGIKKLFALRDFLITDQDNHSLGSAVSAWLIINIKTRRPVRMKPFIEKLNILEAEHVLPNGLDKLPQIEQYTHEQCFRVRHRDIDLNQHVNNVSYIEWVLESIPGTVPETKVLKELEINFQGEAHFGDYVFSRCQPQNDDHTSFLHGIIRKKDGQEVVRAKTIWSEKT